MKMDLFISELAKQCGPVRDLSDDAQTESILTIASKILESDVDVSELATIIYESDPTASPVLISAVKAAESYRLLEQSPPCHLTVLFAMYHEANRIRPQSKEVPTGQNFLRNKVKQLEWLFKANPGCTWDLVGCDDGCDQDSGKLAEGIISAEGWGSKVRVLYLQDMINRPVPIPMFSSIKTTKDSRKGGSILYGMYDTMENSVPLARGKPHYVIYTDADLSLGMEQSGFLLHKCLVQGFSFAQGARYGYKDSFLVKESGASPHPESHFEQPNVMHITWRHFLRKHLLPDISHLYDTNVPMKCFNVQDFPDLLSCCTIFGPAFDMQLLLSAIKHYSKTSGKSASEVAGVEPILFTEDFLESNFTGNADNPDASYDSFCRMSKEIAQMHHEYKEVGAEGEAAEVLAFVEALDMPRYKAMILGVEKAAGRRLLFDYEFDLSQLKEAIAAAGYK